MIKLSVVCLCLAIIGIIGIYFITLNTKVEKIPIEEIDNTYIGRTITTSGKVVSASYSKNGNIFLTIQDRAKINVVIFSNVAKFMDRHPKKGDYVIITGVVGEYRDKLQIVPRKPEDVIIR